MPDLCSAQPLEREGRERTSSVSMVRSSGPTEIPRDPLGQLNLLPTALPSQRARNGGEGIFRDRTRDCCRIVPHSEFESLCKGSSSV